MRRSTAWRWTALASALATAGFGASTVRAQDEDSTPPAKPSSEPAEPALNPELIDPTLLLPTEDPSGPDSRLEIYGFSDFTFTGTLLGEDNRWRGYVNPHTNMGVGNLNVYLKGNLSERARSLIELRFTYLPNGQQTIQPDGSVRYTDTTVRDPLEFNRLMRWGGVVIERAWVEYDFHDLLTVRAGQFLTPYGIWIVDHGSPTIIGIRRPFVITEAFLPERQTGIEVYGRRHFSQGLMGYHLTVSNGRGIAEEYTDFDSSKAFGGRLFFSTRAVGELVMGTSFYTAERIDRRDRWTLVNGVRTFESTEIARSQELALAADLKWLWKDLHFQAEILTRRRDFDDRKRERLGDYAYPAFVPDNRRWGAYALLGYRTPFAGIMPYVVIEEVTFPTGDISRASGLHVGLNYRPEPALVLKAELVHAWFPDALKTSFGVDTLTLYSAQVAWVF